MELMNSEQLMEIAKKNYEKLKDKDNHHHDYTWEDIKENVEYRMGTIEVLTEETFRDVKEAGYNPGWHIGEIVFIGGEDDFGNIDTVSSWLHDSRKGITFSDLIVDTTIYEAITTLKQP